MLDQYQREITYVRLSVTERCNLRCVYCQPDACPQTGSRLLSVDDIRRIVRALAALGFGKVRLTGGEPLLRLDLEAIIAAVAGIAGIRDISMTTNGQGLADRAAALKDAGLKRVNISLDTLRAERYRQITGGSIEPVLASIDACLQAGVRPVKLNAVLMRGVNDDEIGQLIDLTRERDLAVRFIELMPLNRLGRTQERLISGAAILEAYPDLQKLPILDPCQPSEDYRMPGYVGTVGLIRPVSHRFCTQCNRIRITADGMLKPCLGDVQERSLLPALAVDDQTLQAQLAEAIFDKPAGHHFSHEFKPVRGMNRTGG
jgi:cyclic pyranopterin phosphate synthase